MGKWGERQTLMEAIKKRENNQRPRISCAPTLAGHAPPHPVGPPGAEFQ